MGFLWGKEVGRMEDLRVMAEAGVIYAAFLLLLKFVLDRSKRFEEFYFDKKKEESGKND